MCRIGCLACQDKFCVKNPLDIKENDAPTFNFAPHQSCLFGLHEFGLLHGEDVTLL
jgi:hypothetical protein